MTKILQILFAFILGLILVFWVADIFWGIPVQLSDRSSSEGWFEDKSRFEVERYKYLLRTLIYAIPTITLLTLTVMSIMKKDGRLFYWTFFIGLTLLQGLPLLGLLNVNGQATPVFIKRFLIALFLVLLIGQVYSIYKINSNKTLKIKQ